MIDFSQVTNITLGSTPVEQVTDSQGNVLWSAAPVDPSTVYFYVEDASGSDSFVNIQKRNSTDPTVTVYYSTDRQNWELMGNSDTTAITVPLPANGKIYLKSTNSNWSTTSNSGNSIYSNRLFNVGGNIMSLIYGDNFYGQTSFPTDTTFNFSNLFTNGALVDASKLVLPATTLTTGCYFYMFRNSYLTIPPKILPATTLASSCYYYMFSGSAITQAPILPATTLANYCYDSMFRGCSSLTTAPTLPANTLADYCYRYMFQDCTALTTAPARLPASTLKSQCYNSMFRGCTALTTAPVLPARTLASSCYASMFSGCTSLTTAPALPATTLATNCYGSMFNGCTSLVNVSSTFPSSKINIGYNNACNGMFKDCTSLTSSPVINANDIYNSSCLKYMFQNCSSLNSVTVNIDTIYSTNLACLTDWLSGVSATGTFHNLTCFAYPSGASGIPTGWTEVHSTGSTINVTITNTSNYSGATYQIDNGTVEPINETGTTSFTVPTTATSLTVNRNGKGTTDILGVCGISSDTEWTTVIPVNKMSNNVSIDLVSLM